MTNRTDILLHCTADGLIQRASGDVAGNSPAQLVGQHLESLLTQESAERLRQVVDALEDVQTLLLEFRQGRACALCHAVVMATLDASTGFLLLLPSRSPDSPEIREATDAALSLLARGVVHDLNNHLTVLRGNAELLGYLFEDAPRELQQIDVGLDRVQAFLRSLRLLAHRERWQPEPVDLGTAIDQALGELRLNQELAVVWTPPGEPWPVLAEPELLRQALRGMILTVEPGSSPAAPIQLALRRENPRHSLAHSYGRLFAGHYCVLHCGGPAELPEDRRLRLLDPYFNARDPLRTHTVDLALARSLAHQGGGGLLVGGPPGLALELWLPDRGT